LSERFITNQVYQGHEKPHHDVFLAKQSHFQYSTRMEKYVPEKLFQVPEGVLVQLLKDGGHSSSPREYLAAHRHKIEAGEMYQKRARVAYWSIVWLGFSTAFSLFSFAVHQNWEDFISVILLGTMTYVEFHVRRWFIDGDIRGSTYGYWNQTAFALAFLVYGIYHALIPSPILSSPALLELAGQEAINRLVMIATGGYLLIGVVCGACQYSLALYYKRSLHPKLAPQPPPLP